MDESRIECAGVILMNEAGEMLLNLRASNASWHPDTWDLIGGHLEEGETAEECITRETNEETGELVTEFLPFETYSLSLEGNVALTYHVFLARLDKSAESLVIGEGQEHRFFGAEAVVALEMAPVTARVLHDFLVSPGYRMTK